MNESFEAIRALAHGQLSLKARIGYVALLLAATAMSVVVAALWMTEPALPARTQAAFGVMTVIGVSWVALAAWVLSARRPLYARDRVIAGRMAVAFTTVFAFGGLIALLNGGGEASVAAFSTGLVMLAMSFAALRAARQRFGALSARRAELERSIAGTRT
jgi:hypothetical protein